MNLETKQRLMKLDQKKRILEYMGLFGSINSLTAFSELRITQAHTRFFELKAQGHNFNQKWNKKLGVYDYTLQETADSV